jgi:hypothetical protein
MVDKKVSGLTEVTSLADNDILTAVDVSDQSMSTSGTNVKIVKSNLFTGYENTTQLNARDVNNRNRANHTGTQPFSSIVVSDNSIPEAKLVDYNESFFTPVLRSANNDVVATYTVQEGLLIKKGKQVLCVFNIGWSALTATGDMYIGGMPLAKSYSDKTFRFPLQLAYFNSLSLPVNTSMVGYIQDNTDYIKLLYGDNTGFNNDITSTHLTTSGEIYGSVNYIIA